MSSSIPAVILVSFQSLLSPSLFLSSLVTPFPAGLRGWGEASGDRGGCRVASGPAEPGERAENTAA